MTASALHVFSTCPPSSAVPSSSYVDRIVEVARWSEEAGCRGALVYSDNSLVDPWIVSQILIEHTRTLSPLVAVQPVYMHPYTVARQISSLGCLYDRRVCLNMVAGGFVNDLEALDDVTPHDQRYARLIEYTRIITSLLGSDKALTADGRFHRVSKLKLAPPMPEGLMPDILVSGSSEAGIGAARALNATAIRYPRPAAEDPPAPPDLLRHGIRVGIIARDDSSEAWQVARERFPEDRKGQITRGLASKVSDSSWHRQLMQVNETAGPSPYWLVPFHNYKTNCPYLVGSYADVGAELSRYFAAGCRTVILDVPTSPDDLGHAFAAFDHAAAAVL